MTAFGQSAKPGFILGSSSKTSSPTLHEMQLTSEVQIRHQVLLGIGETLLGGNCDISSGNDMQLVLSHLRG